MATLSVFDGNGVIRHSKGELFGLEVKIEGKSHKGIISISEILEFIKNHPSYIEKTLSLASENEADETQLKKFKHLRTGV